MINVYKYLMRTKVEGPGVRFCLWVQGCKRHCQGCFAKETWSFKENRLYSVEDIYSLIPKDVEGVTFLGGEPFEQASELAKLAEICQKDGLSVVCFTGYTYEEINADCDINKLKFLEHIDLLIDGEYDNEKFDLSRPWVGSSNQRYIFLSDRYSMDDVKKHKNKIEMRLAKDGKLEVNGMGDFTLIEKDFCLQLGKNIVE